jgi:predicted nucleic acid-binding protein
MAFLITDVQNENPQSGISYLFDANIWLAILDPNFQSRFYTNSVRFFNKIINNSVVNDAKIAIPTMLLSEIINRLLKDVYFRDFSLENPNVNSINNYYKNIYRKSNQYKEDLEIVCASIRAYHAHIQFVSDNANKYTCKQLIKNIPTHLDMNDYIYTKIAKEQGLVIVTNDGDFQVEDIQIYTSHRELLALK